MSRTHDELLSKLSEREGACAFHLRTLERITGGVKELEDIAEERLQYMESRNDDFRDSRRQMRNESDRVWELEAQFLSEDSSMSTLQSDISEMARQLDSFRGTSACLGVENWRELDNKFPWMAKQLQWLLKEVIKDPRGRRYNRELDPLYIYLRRFAERDYSIIAHLFGWFNFQFCFQPLAAA